MTGFCVREMRKEYRGVSRLYTGTALLFLLAFACISAVMRARGADVRVRLLLIGLDGFVVLALLGVHLILTDDRNLIQKTPFGEALRELGDPHDILRQIDESAAKRFDLYSSFALTESWLILYYTSPWKYEARRVCAWPFSRKDIRFAELIPVGKANSSGQIMVRLHFADSPAWELSINAKDEWESMRDWLREQENVRDD